MNASALQVDSIGPRKSRELELFNAILVSNAVQLLEEPRQLPKNRRKEDIPSDLQMMLADINICLFRHYPDLTVTPGVLHAKEAALKSVFSKLADTLYEKKGKKGGGYSQLKKISRVDDKELATALAETIAELYRLQPFAVGNSESICAFAQIVAASMGRHLGFDRMPAEEVQKFITHLEYCATTVSSRPIPDDKVKQLASSIADAISLSKNTRPKIISTDTTLDATRASFKDVSWDADTSMRWHKDHGLVVHEVQASDGKQVKCLVTIDGQHIPVDFIRDWAERRQKLEREFRLKERHVAPIRDGFGIETHVPDPEKIDGISLINGVPLLKMDEDLLTGIPLRQLRELEDEARQHEWLEYLEDPSKLKDFVEMLKTTDAHEVEKRYGLKKDDLALLEKAVKRLKNGMLAHIDQCVHDSHEHMQEAIAVNASAVAEPKALVVTGVESDQDIQEAELQALQYFGKEGFVTVSDRAMLSQLAYVSTLSALDYRPRESETNPYPFATGLLRAIRNKQMQFLKTSHCYHIYAETGLSPDRSDTEELLQSTRKTGADIDVISLMKPIEEIAHRKSNGGLNNPMSFLLLSSRISRNQFMGIGNLLTTADIAPYGEDFIPRGSHVVNKHTGLIQQPGGSYKPIAIVSDNDSKLSEAVPDNAIVVPIRSGSQQQHDRSMVILDTDAFARYIAYGAKLNPHARNPQELFINSEAEGLLNVALGTRAIEDSLKNLRVQQYLSMGSNLMNRTIDGVTALKQALQDPNGLGKEFVRAVEMIRESKGRVLISGVGKSLRVGELLAASLGSLGIPCDTIDPTHGVHGDLGKMDANAGNLLIAISKSGNSKELQPVVEEARKRGLQIISVTHKADSFLGKSAKEAGNNGVLLKIPDTGEPTPFDEAGPKVSPPTVSTTQVKVLIEAIALAVAESRGMKVKDFGEHHPAGALGSATKQPKAISLTVV